jgi:hypothetical protein
MLDTFQKAQGREIAASPVPARIRKRWKKATVSLIYQSCLNSAQGLNHRFKYNLLDEKVPDRKVKKCRLCEMLTNEPVPERI